MSKKKYTLGWRDCQTDTTGLVKFLRTIVTLLLTLLIYLFKKKKNKNKNSYVGKNKTK